MIERIHLQQLQLQARVGVPDEERAKPQRLVSNITLVPPSREIHDDLANTIDYAAVADRVQAIVSRRERRLIETLAEEIAGELLQEFRAVSVEVELRKFVIPETEFVSVTAIRKAG